MHSTNVINKVMYYMCLRIKIDRGMSGTALETLARESAVLNVCRLMSPSSGSPIIYLKYSPSVESLST